MTTPQPVSYLGIFSQEPHTIAWWRRRLRARRYARARELRDVDEWLCAMRDAVTR